MTAAQALETVRRQGRDTETVCTLYATDDTRRPEGVLSLRDLVMAQGDQLIADIMTGDIVVQVFLGHLL